MNPVIIRDTVSPVSSSKIDAPIQTHNWPTLLPDEEGAGAALDVNPSDNSALKAKGYETTPPWHRKLFQQPNLTGATLEGIAANRRMHHPDDTRYEKAHLTSYSPEVFRLNKEVASQFADQVLSLEDRTTQESLQQDLAELQSNVADKEDRMAENKTKLEELTAKFKQDSSSITPEQAEAEMKAEDQTEMDQQVNAYQKATKKKLSPEMVQYLVKRLTPRQLQRKMAVSAVEREVGRTLTKEERKEIRPIIQRIAELKDETAKLQSTATELKTYIEENNSMGASGALLALKTKGFKLPKFLGGKVFKEPRTQAKADIEATLRSGKVNMSDDRAFMKSPGTVYGVIRTVNGETVCSDRVLNVYIQKMMAKMSASEKAEFSSHFTEATPVILQMKGPQFKDMMDKLSEASTIHSATLSDHVAVTKDGIRKGAKELFSYPSSFPHPSMTEHSKGTREIALGEEDKDGRSEGEDLSLLNSLGYRSDISGENPNNILSPSKFKELDAIFSENKPVFTVADKSAEKALNGALDDKMRKEMTASTALATQMAPGKVDITLKLWAASFSVAAFAGFLLSTLLEHHVIEPVIHHLMDNAGIAPAGPNGAFSDGQIEHFIAGDGGANIIQSFIDGSPAFAIEGIDTGIVGAAVDKTKDTMAKIWEGLKDDLPTMALGGGLNVAAITAFNAVDKATTLSTGVHTGLELALGYAVANTGGTSIFVDSAAKKTNDLITLNEAVKQGWFNQNVQQKLFANNGQKYVRGLSNLKDMFDTDVQLGRKSAFIINAAMAPVVTILSGQHFLSKPVLSASIAPIVLFSMVNPIEMHTLLPTNIHANAVFGRTMARIHESGFALDQNKTAGEAAAGFMSYNGERILHAPLRGIVTPAYTVGRTTVAAVEALGLRERALQIGNAIRAKRGQEPKVIGVNENFGRIRDSRKIATIRYPEPVANPTKPNEIENSTLDPNVSIEWSTPESAAMARKLLTPVEGSSALRRQNASRDLNFTNEDLGALEQVMADVDKALKPQTTATPNGQVLQS